MSQPEHPSLYPLNSVKAEVLSVIATAKRLATEEQMAGAVGVSPSEFSRKKRATTAQRFFNFEQLGSLASLLETRGMKLPPGWPLVTRIAWSQIKTTLAPDSD